MNKNEVFVDKFLFINGIFSDKEIKSIGTKSLFYDERFILCFEHYTQNLPDKTKDKINLFINNVYETIFSEEKNKKHREKVYLSAKYVYSYNKIMNEYELVHGRYYNKNKLIFIDNKQILVKKDDFCRSVRGIFENTKITHGLMSKCPGNPLFLVYNPVEPTTINVFEFCG